MGKCSRPSAMARRDRFARIRTRRAGPRTEGTISSLYRKRSFRKTAEGDFEDKYGPVRFSDRAVLFPIEFCRHGIPCMHNLFGHISRLTSLDLRAIITAITKVSARGEVVYW